MQSGVTTDATEILDSVTGVFPDCIELIKTILSTKETPEYHYQRKIKR